MKKNKNKGFTLIELIAVLVIMAIIALIVTPLVLNIVRKAKDSANKRSVDAYGKSIDLAVASYLLDKGDFPTSIDELTIEYSGKEVVCGVAKLNEDSSLYLSKCSVGGVEVKDSNNKDGYYHYGKLDKIVYQSYKIGDIVTYNEMNFYVISDSDENSNSVTMLKAEPLTVKEIEMYGVGHINRYASACTGVVCGGVEPDDIGSLSAYYSSETCGFPDGTDHASVSTGCTTNYDKSDVKFIVDNWSNDFIKSSDLQIDNFGYKIRLITIDELEGNLGYTYSPDTGGAYSYYSTENTPDWVRGDYFTMSAYGDSNLAILCVQDGSIYGKIVYGQKHSIHDVRPVVTLLKSAL